jgi:LPXTG-motif cell wall-anchored protein
MVFTASQECTPPDPSPPDIPHTGGFDTIQLLAGFSLLLLGILLRRKKTVSAQ